MRVACPAAAPAKDHPDQSYAAPLDRGDKIEARGVDIACLDAVRAGIVRKKLVVIAEPLAAPAKRFGREEAEILWEVTPNGDGQPRHVTRRGALLAVRQSRGVAECRA